MTNGGVNRDVSISETCWIERLGSLESAAAGDRALGDDCWYGGEESLTPESVGAGAMETGARLAGRADGGSLHCQPVLAATQESHTFASSGVFWSMRMGDLMQLQSARRDDYEGHGQLTAACAWCIVVSIIHTFDLDMSVVGLQS